MRVAPSPRSFVAPSIRVRHTRELSGLSLVILMRCVSDSAKDDERSDDQDERCDANAEV